MLIEIDTPLAELMAKLECDPALIHDVKLANLQALYMPQGVKVLAASGEFHVAPVMLGVLSEILTGKVLVKKLDGTMGAAANLARVGLEKSVKHVLNAMGAVHNLGSPSPTVDIATTEDLSSIFKVQPKKAMTDNTFTMTLPALKDATELYQPVRGTDPGSKYFAIALSSGLNVGARLKHKGSISLRIEGLGLKAMKESLKSSGFADSGTHCSVHLAAATDELALKTVGAMLFSIAWPFDKAATSLSQIWGKGQ